MLRILKSAVAMTLVLALAACSSVTAPVDDDSDVTVERTVGKSQIEEPSEGSGGTNPPAEEEQEEETSGGGRGRGNGGR